MRKAVSLCAAIIVGIIILSVGDVLADRKKILYVASYHTEKEEWSGGIKAGIKKVLDQRKDVELKIFNMDTRLSRSEGTKEAAAISARELIADWKPDLVITSDDNAAKYLIEPYYKNADLPFVFCGLNWDASIYGFPVTNVTGMIEVQLIDKIIEYLSPYAGGTRLGSLRGDTMTNYKEQMHFENYLKQSFDVRYVDSLSAWKRQFDRLQTNTDMLVLGSLGALDLEGASMTDIETFVTQNTRIPTAAYDAFMKDISLITLSTIPEEQGQWAATKALEILNGTPPSEIPITANKKGKLYLNLHIAKKLGIKFPIELLEWANLVGAK